MLFTQWAWRVAVVSWCIAIVVVGLAHGEDRQPSCSPTPDTASASTDQKKILSANKAPKLTEGSAQPQKMQNEKSPEKGDGTAAPTGPTAAGREIEIGCIFEQQDRLDDAEKAYAKALETATGTERDDARTRLEKLLAKKRGFKAKYVEPWLEKLRASFSQVLFGVLGAILALFFLWVLKRVLQPLGKVRGKGKLQIGDFVDATESHAGLALAEVMKNAVEEAKAYFKPRDPFLRSAFGSLVVLQSPGSPELVDLVAEVVPGGWSKLLTFIAKSLSMPEYVITGTVQKAGSQFSFLIKLIRRGATIQTWQIAVPAGQVSSSQDDLALDVAMHLKEVVERNGN